MIRPQTHHQVFAVAFAVIAILNLIQGEAEIAVGCLILGKLELLHEDVER